MFRLSIIMLLTAALVGLGPSACSTKEVVGGAAIGGAAYEYSNKRAMDALKEDYEAGRINNTEYERRKKEIEGRSLVY
ncbi:hypothetical protein [Sedimenticola hydrogenitrophicus]|uniref:hypothetical protein n=1 Tax=Sedimenticola hydrogenitrophicus TaxID=2967975 RepID=UPI0023AF6FB4|nr:hypothetical protein [Sedimenticola hydrogenitrophicus]